MTDRVLTAEGLHSKALTADQVADLLQYYSVRGKRKGQPCRETVYRMAREGLIPGPIDPLLNPRSWRWSTALILVYMAGEWKRGAA